MNHEKITQLMDALQILRGVDPQMSVGMMLTLLEVSKGNGVTGRDLEIALDFPHATAARQLRYFDRLVKAGTPGLDLFKVELDPVDYKAKLRFLNDKGEALMKQLDAALTSK